MEITDNLKNILRVLSPFMVAIFAFLLKKFFNSRPKLIAYYGHFSRHTLKKTEPNITIFTHSVVIRNISEQTATNVRLGHRKVTDANGVTLDFPEINIYPEVNYTTIDLPEGGKEIIFPTLVNNKQITISYLYFYHYFWNFNTYVECNEGAAEIVTTITEKALPIWKKFILISLILIGASTSLYFIMLTLLRF
jgi:hypothetical protein